MAKRKPLTDDEGESREWTAEDFRRAVPFSALPAKERKMLLSLKKHRKPQETSAKQVVWIHLSQDVVSKLRASGRGWQARVDKHLREWLKEPRRKRA